MRQNGFTIKDLMLRQTKVGEVVYISIRPERRKPPLKVDQVFADSDSGLEGDHYSGGPGSKRQVTLINEEHIQAIASFVGNTNLDPDLLRRNIVVRGINLLSLKDREFKIGDARLRMTGQCHPCSRMEENLGKGGYNAMRGHGGITTTIIKSGWIRKGDEITLMADENQS